jgi:hypothetical protein
MADVRTSEMDEKLAPFNVEHNILYGDRSLKDERLLNGPIFRNQKYERVGVIEIYIHILFHGDNS